MLGILKRLKCRNRRQQRKITAALRNVVEQFERRILLAGNGLAATYFDNANLSGTSVSRVDSTINFDWGVGSPDSHIAADTFSARWTGQIQAAKSEAYTFYTTSDDGVRLWVDGKLAIDDWSVHAPREDKATLNLQAGTFHDIKLEYYEQEYGAVMKLLWSSASTAKQVIPQSQLYSTPLTAPDATPPTAASGNGLAVTYFDNSNFSGTSITRVDPNVNFDWGVGSPDSSIDGDTFSARWIGQVQPNKTEAYTFYTTSDDGVRLWIDGKLIIDDWSVHAPREDKATLNLQAGTFHDIKLEYCEQQYGAVMKLLWSSASTPKQIIPQAQLFSTAQATPAPTPTSSPIIGNGNGLLATYFDNADLTGKSVARTDKTVNFDWGVGSPDSSIAADTFSARWTGQILAEKTEEYTFYTQSDDGVRLWVNGQKLIDNWTEHAPKEDSGKITLEAGKKYDIKIEYYEQQYGAVMQFKWSSASLAKQIVPQTQLFSATPVNQPSDTPPTTVPPPVQGPVTTIHGLLGTYFDNTDFTGSTITRYDSLIQFDWGTSSPHAVIGTDHWAARWQGQIVAAKSEQYTFYTTSDGACRLWIDGKLVIDDGVEHAKREVAGKITLAAGRHDIKLEYVLQTAQAVMQLRWSSPSIAKQYVPSTSLYAAAPPVLNLPVPPITPFTGYKTYSSTQVNFRPGDAADKSLLLDGYRISNVPIDTKGMNIAVTDLVPGQKAFAYKNITIRNTEISGVYRTPGFHNDFIRIAGAAGRQDVPMNLTFENIKIHDGQAIPILITDGDYDTIIIRNVSITNCTVNQLQINTQNVGSVKHIIVENCPGLSVAIIGRAGTIGDCIVRNSPDAGVSDSLNQQGVKSGVKFTVLP